MISSFLITSRETLEASLVVGIVLAYLVQTKNTTYRKYVWYGVIAGILASIVGAVGFNVFAGGFEGQAEYLFEGFTMLIGAFLLTTMILWMMQQRRIVQELHGKVDRHLAAEKPLFSYVGIFLLIFVAVLREGIETVIFLNAANYAGGWDLLGGFVGIAVAILLGYLFFTSARKFKLSTLFTVSSILLIFFAAGLVAHGVHELEEASLVNPVVYPLYNINGVISENSVFGGFLKGLFGYNGNPSLVEVIVYWVYLLGIFSLYFYMQKSSSKTVRT